MTSENSPERPWRRFEDVYGAVSTEAVTRRGAKPITQRLVQAVALDVVTAAQFLNARSELRGDYRARKAITRTTDVRLVDRGADVALVMAVTASLVRYLAERQGSSSGNADPDHARKLLFECRRAIVWGMNPEPIGVAWREEWDESGNRHSWLEELEYPYTPPPTVTPYEANVRVTVLQLADPRLTLQQTYDRAEAWSQARGLVASLEVILAGAELINYFASLADNEDVILDSLVVQLLEELPSPNTKGNNDNE